MGVSVSHYARHDNHLGVRAVYHLPHRLAKELRISKLTFATTDNFCRVTLTHNLYVNTMYGSGIATTNLLETNKIRSNKIVFFKEIFLNKKTTNKKNSVQPHNNKKQNNKNKRFIFPFSG